MSKNDGGPAFPLKDPRTCDYHGMSLRDYFAAKAMQAIRTELSLSAAICAKQAYDLADAMLAEKERRAREEGK